MHLLLMQNHSFRIVEKAKFRVLEFKVTPFTFFPLFLQKIINFCEKKCSHWQSKSIQFKIYSQLSLRQTPLGLALSVGLREVSVL